MLLPAQVYYRAGETVYWRVIVSAPGAEDVVREGSFTVTAETPVFLKSDGSSHGGDAERILHVRIGAKGLGTGENWADAYTDMASAVAGLSPTARRLSPLLVLAK